MTTANLSVIRGDDKYYIITLKDDDAVAIDITGWTVYFTVKADTDDTDENAKISKDVISHTDPTGGVTQIHLTHSDTALEIGNYYYDIQVKKSDGTIMTVMAGNFYVTQDITTRTT